MHIGVSTAPKAACDRFCAIPSALPPVIQPPQVSPLRRTPPLRRLRPIGCTSISLPFRSPRLLKKAQRMNARETEAAKVRKVPIGSGRRSSSPLGFLVQLPIRSSSAARYCAAASIQRASCQPQRRLNVIVRILRFISRAIRCAASTSVPAGRLRASWPLPKLGISPASSLTLSATASPFSSSTLNVVRDYSMRPFL